MSKKADLLTEIARMAKAFPKASMTETNIEAFVHHLDDIPPPLLKEAVDHFCQTAKWFPSIAEIRGYCADMTLDAYGIPTAYEAWQNVLINIGERSVKWRHPLVRLALDEVASLRDIGMGPLGAIPSHRARFIEAYERKLARLKDYVQSKPELRRLKENTKRREYLRLFAEERLPKRLGVGDDDGSTD